MFSRFLNSARNIITFSKPDQDVESGKKSPAKRPLKSPLNRTPAKTTTPARKSAMVTTRRQSGALLASQSESVTNSENDDLPYELLSTSARKRRRAQLSEKAKAAGEDEISTPTTKRRKLPVRNKREDFPENVHSHIAVVIPPMDTQEEALPEPTSKPASKKSKRTPKKKEAPAAVELVEEDDIVEQNTTASEPEAVVEEDVIVVQSPAKTATGRKKKADVTQPEADKSPAKPETETPVAAPKHKKFGDDDAIVVTAPPPPAEVVEEKEEEEAEEESSDDEAPEEVGAQAAQEKVKDAAREAAKAVELKEAAERLKRKERDAQLKSQAQAAKKRKHIEDDVDESVTINESSITVEPLARTTTKPKFNRSNLPDLLPEEFLNDDVEEAELESEEEAPRKSKKIKFLYPEEKKPKDKKLGSTTYRVAQTNKEGLAPKASKSALAMKAALLGGRKGQIRKAVSGGFFAAKKARK